MNVRDSGMPRTQTFASNFYCYIHDYKTPSLLLTIMIFFSYTLIRAAKSTFFKSNVIIALFHIPYYFNKAFHISALNKKQNRSFILQ